MTKMVYFAYPYTVDPTGCTEEIKVLVRRCVLDRYDVLGEHDIVPIVPHVTFDGLYDFPAGYSHDFMLRWEFEVIARCDAICFPPTERKSEGCRWERQFAIWYKVSVVSYDELCEGAAL